MSQHKSRTSGDDGQERLRCEFIDPPSLAAETGGRKVKQGWRATCPLCGGDLAIDWGDNKGNTVLTCHGKPPCNWKALSAWGRSKGWWFDPAAPETKPKSRLLKKWASREFVLGAALTKAERIMVDLLDADPDRAQRDFYAGGVRPGAVSPGLRVIEALGLYGVKHSPIKARADRYQRNRHWRLEGWRALLRGTREEARAQISAVAKAARKGVCLSDTAKAATTISVPSVPTLSAYVSKASIRASNWVETHDARPLTGQEGGIGTSAISDRGAGGASRTRGSVPWEPCCIECKGDCVKGDACGRLRAAGLR
jgi:hypothetical protein